jgi:hypothetical protein
VLGEPWLALPAALDWAIASLTAASGMEPSALARWRYIHSSAPTGSGVTAGKMVGTFAVPSLLVTAAIPMAKRIITAAAATTIGA